MFSSRKLAKYVSILAVVALAFLLLQPDVAARPRKKKKTKLVYPETKKVDVDDDYHGVQVPDPYRWLEDENARDTKAWVKAQNKVTFGWLEDIPERERILERLTNLYNFEKYKLPRQKGGRYFYEKNDGLQDQYVLHTGRSLEGEPRVLLDPNKLSKDGTIALMGYEASEDASLLAYSISDAGSDWREVKVRDVKTGKDQEDHLKWVKFSGISWTHDNKGFFYSRYDEPKSEEELTGVNYYHKLYYHRVGAPQSADELIYENPEEKEWGINGLVTDDGRYLIIHIQKGSARKNLIYYKDLQDPNGKVVKLIDEFEALYAFVDNDGPVFWFRTDNKAPKGRVIAIDINEPEPKNWKEIIRQSGDALREVDVINDKFICLYLANAQTRVMIYDLTGRFEQRLRLPGIGTAGGFEGRKTDKETFYVFTSFATPPTIYRYDAADGASSVFREPNVDFDPTRFRVDQVYCNSKDRTRIPMFLAHVEGARRDGTNPTLLYGYGGFNVAITPYFSVTNLVWMEMGGIYAVANIRGGGEYGKDWHEAGMKENRQNVFDDFIAAAEWLIETNYTSAPKLAIHGESNGGLLVGACMAQRPDLYGACIPEVGVLDMLRFHKFTIGWAWASDYGTSDDPALFKVLRSYSPLHNIKAGTAYPATFIMTSDHDDRVVPAHSFKFAAALQEAQSGPAPVLIRIEERAGHGAGTPTRKRLEASADRLGFLARALKMDVPAKLGVPKKKPRPPAG
ncbi:MAG: S9 family peptidase [Phycisphaerales bacterium]|nr:MAG: S9 family peptidase [Phycisphaerales bacterium]